MTKEEYIELFEDIEPVVNKNYYWFENTKKSTMTVLPTKEFLDVFKATNGALSVTESIAIMNIAAQAPKGDWLEMGTFHGKSAMSAAYGFGYKFNKKENPPTFYLLDPIFIGKELALEVMKNVYATMLMSGSGFGINVNEDYSTDYLQKIQHMYSYVFSDAGSHQDGLPMQEVKLLEDRIIKNGIIAFHDFDSQFKEVREAYNYLVETGKYEEITINWQEIVAYVNEHDLEANNNSWHHSELRNPCFVGALKRIQ